MKHGVQLIKKVLVEVGCQNLEEGYKFFFSWAAINDQLLNCSLRATEAGGGGGFVSENCYL